MSVRLITGKVHQVWRRQLAVQVIRWAATGLLLGSAAGLVLGVVRWATPRPFPTNWALPLLAAGPIAGALLALVRAGGQGQAAAAIDALYRFKDRTLTALDFESHHYQSPIHELQQADAEAHVARVEPWRVVPVRMPRVLPVAVGVFAAALALLLWPRPQPLQAKPAAPLDQVVAAAEGARESLEELKSLAKKEKDPKLEKLVRDLAAKVEQMKQPGVDVKEALAKLSEMQAAINAEQAQYNVALVDAQMQSLGEALTSSQSLEAAGQALQEGKYDKAADELEKADPKFDRKEAKTLKDKLKKAAKAMADGGLAELSEATTEMADSLEDENQADGACDKLGKLAKAQGRRKKITDLLNMQCQNLGECKGECQNPKNNTAKFKLRKKSEKPSSNWGMATSGNTDGDPTKLDSARKREVVKGQSGDGPSEAETTHSPEGRQTATREYRDNYQKYKKMTEAALNSEPIPLGHRQTIRRYFELIRPQGEEAKQADPGAAATPGS